MKMIANAILAMHYTDSVLNSSKFVIFKILIFQTLNFASPAKISASKITRYTVTWMRWPLKYISYYMHTL